MKTLNTMKRTAIASIASVTLGMSLAAPAQADMFAYAKLLLENFVILGSDGEALDATPEEDFSFLSYTSTGDMDGSLSGTAGFSNTANVSDASDIDFAADCLTTTGDCNPLLAENSFPFITGPQGIDYVAADQQQSGSPIDGLLPTTGATIGAVSAASLSTTSAAGSANANNGLQAGFVFSLDQDQGITFEGDISVYLEAFASADEIAPSSASAATEFLITITDISVGAGNEIVFDSRDVPLANLLTQTTARNAGVPGALATCGSLVCGVNLPAFAFSFTTVELTAGNVYQLSARTNVNVDINRTADIPEPGIIALMGVGLLGMFAAGRRRRSV